MVINPTRYNPILGYSSHTYQFQHTICQQHGHILDRRLGLMTNSCKGFRLVAFGSVRRCHAPIYQFGPVSFQDLLKNKCAFGINSQGEIKNIIIL